jgi:hypothetical protein
MVIKHQGTDGYIQDLPVVNVVPDDHALIVDLVRRQVSFSSILQLWLSDPSLLQVARSRALSRLHFQGTLWRSSVQCLIIACIDVPPIIIFSIILCPICEAARDQYNSRHLQFYAGTSQFFPRTLGSLPKDHPRRTACIGVRPWMEMEVAETRRPQKTRLARNVLGRNDLSPKPSQKKLERAYAQTLVLVNHHPSLSVAYSDHAPRHL